MAPLFLTTIRTELVFPSTAATTVVRPELLFPGTTTVAVRPNPKLAFPRTGTATDACCRVRMGTDNGGLGLMRFNRASARATAGIACGSVRMGTDYGGFILLRVNPASSQSMAPPPKTKVTMLACSNQEKVPERLRSFGDEDDEFDKFYAALSEETEALLANIFTIHPLPISEEERALQNKLKEIVERCMDLQADAMRRLRPEQRCPMYLVFRTSHLSFASVKVRATEGHANLGVSSLLIVDKLDVVRKMVSSACSAPLPLDTHNLLVSSHLLPPLLKEAITGLSVITLLPPEEQEVTFALIEYTYNTVKSDIDKMITASATSTSS